MKRLEVNSHLEFTVGEDDVIRVTNPAGEELFRDHQPGAYERVKTGTVQNVSVGYWDNRIYCLTFVTPRNGPAGEAPVTGSPHAPT